MHPREREPGVDAPSFQKNRARTALAMIAAFS